MDSSLLGVVIAGALGVAGSWVAAFWGARVARTTTKVVDDRAESESRWRRIEAAAKLAVSENEGEATLGVDLLEDMADRWNDDPEQRRHIRVALKAALRPEVQAYRSLRPQRVVTSRVDSESTEEDE